MREFIQSGIKAAVGEGLFDTSQKSRGSFLTWVILLTVLISVLLFLLLQMRKHNILKKKMRDTKEQLEVENKKLKGNYELLQTKYHEVAEKLEERKKAEEKLKKLAYEDLLTDLPNRLAFTEKLEHIMLTLRKEETVAVMAVDLDNFSIINNKLGHSYGDELLMDVTDRIKQVLDENDYIARYGGDEFMILTQNMEDIGSYEKKIKQIQKVFTFPFVLSMREFFVTISIGVAFAPKDAKTTQALIKNVDQAMYAAKNIGRSTYCFYDESFNQQLLNRIEMQSELHTAIEKEEIIVYYQPQINLETNQITGWEALARWNHPEKGMLLPEVFLQVAEESGLIIEIGKTVVKKAISCFKLWEKSGFHDQILSINLSERQIQDEKFLDFLEQEIRSQKFSKNRLNLEIQENLILKKDPFISEQIKRLKRVGFTLSLDNFGTGYSSLNCLRKFPLDFLKIDSSFMEAALEKEEDRKMAESLVLLAKALDIIVIAEGVEIPEQEAFLKKISCTRAQGYLYSEPVPEKEVIPILKHFNR